MGEGEGNGVRDWVEERWMEMGCREHVDFMVGCWALWEHRNKVIFDAREVDPHAVLKRVEDVVDEMEGGGFLVSRNGRRGRENTAAEVVAGWEVPLADFVKINVDAGVKEGVGVSAGVVCRDERGKVLWGLSMVQDLAWEAHLAEANAVFEGVREAARRGHSRIVVESDCLAVIDAIKKKAKGRSMFSLHLDHIVFLCNSFVSVLWSYTRRDNNMIAHSLAHSLDSVVGRVEWADVLPPIANNAVIFDSRLIY
ncbi:uncharacterized protein LOC141642451 [Silene latifolia]|uniref:uncharacterized protein LOC141642451 n=1 Tax=Silene latifolia TaxID=37657 RepID=UPI003D7732D0